MKSKFLSLSFLILFFNLQSQTPEELEVFGEQVLEEANLIYELIYTADQTKSRLKSKEVVSYKNSNEEIITICWNDNLEVTAEVNKDSLNSTKREPSFDEELLINARNEVIALINSGQLDFEEMKSNFKVAYVFDHKLKNPELTHSSTQLVAYVIRQDLDENLVGLGADYYIEINGLGKINDVFQINQNYYQHPVTNLYKDQKVKGVIQGHGGDDPIISATEIAALMLARDRIQWENLTVTKYVTDSSFIESIFSLPDNKLTLELKSENGFPIPNWAVWIKIGDLSYLEYFNTVEEISTNVFDLIEEDWYKERGMRTYEPHQAKAAYPNLVVGRLGLVELILKKSKLKLLPKELADKLE